MKRIPTQLLLAWLLPVAAALALQLLLFPARAFPVFLEGLAHLAWLLPLGPRLAPLFAPLARGTRRILLALLSLAIFGQLAEQTRFTYPAICWDMYTGRARPTLTALDYRARLASGATETLDPLTSFPTLDPFHFSFILEEMADASTDPALAAYAGPLWKETLASVVKQLNRSRAEPIVSLEVYRVAYDGGGTETSRSLIQQVEP